MIKRYKLSADVFFRTYGENVVVYKTDRKEVLLLNKGSEIILSFFKTENTLTDFLNQTDLKITAEDLQFFVDRLLEEGILYVINGLTEKKSNLESYVKTQLIPEDQLVSVMFELTYRCNEKCRHCYCVQSSKDKELSTQEIKNALDELAKMNVLSVTFTGGDLFVRKDTFEILEYAFSKNFLIDVFTNGTALSAEDIFRLKSLHLRSIHFSVYSHIPERHDYFTQVEGSFEKTLTAIRRCVSIGIPTNIKTIVTNYSFEDIDGILQMAEREGTTIQVSMSVSAKNDGGLSPTGFRLNDVEKYSEIMKKVNEHIEIHCSNDYKQIRFDNKVCGAGSTSLSIDPYGEVFPCNSLLLSCGNIRKQSIKEIWENSTQLKKIRDFVFDKIKGCEECAEKQYCNFCPGNALTETGDPLKRYSEACMLMKAKKLLNEKEE